jgi:hypothetical protein
MPELRLVVLASQERLAYGATFAEALTNLFGDTANTAAASGSTPPPATGDTSPATPPPTNQVARSQAELINRAAADLSDYQRLTAEGKLGEAGQKLESLKRTLDELQKAKQ